MAPKRDYGGQRTLRYGAQRNYGGQRSLRYGAQRNYGGQRTLSMAPSVIMAASAP